MVQSPSGDSNTTSLPFRSHTALLLATALPFLNPTWRPPLELLIKVMELSETLKLYQSFHRSPGSSFFDFLKCGSNKKQNDLWGIIQQYISNPEGLLNCLSSVCTGKEQEIISLLLTLLRAKSFYETYGDMLNSLMGSDSLDFSFLQNLASAPDFSFPQGITPAPESNPAQNTAAAPDAVPAPDLQFTPDGASIPDISGLASMLTQEQTDTINLLKSLLEADE